MFCVHQQSFAADDEQASGDCSWSVIAESIRLHALGKPVVEAVGLNRWADLLDGIAQLEMRSKA